MEGGWEEREVGRERKVGREVDGMGGMEGGRGRERKVGKEGE